MWSYRGIGETHYIEYFEELPNELFPGFKVVTEMACLIGS